MEASKAIKSFINVRDRPFSCGRPPCFPPGLSPPVPSVALSALRACPVSWRTTVAVSIINYYLSFCFYKHWLCCTSLQFLRGRGSHSSATLYHYFIQHCVVAIPKCSLSTGSILCVPFHTPPMASAHPSCQMCRVLGLQRRWHSEVPGGCHHSSPKMSWGLRGGFWRWRVFGILISSSVSTAISFKIKKKKRSLSCHLPPSLCHNSDGYTTETTRGCLQGFSCLFCVQPLLPFRVISFPISLTPNINEFQVKVRRTFPVANVSLLQVIHLDLAWRLQTVHFNFTP